MSTTIKSKFQCQECGTVVIAPQEWKAGNCPACHEATEFLEDVTSEIFPNAAPATTQGRTPWSPLPWSVNTSGIFDNGRGFVIWSANGVGQGSVCRTFREGLQASEIEATRAERNARFIVKAVNNHQKLIEFVEYVRKFYQDNFDVMPVAFQTVDSEAESLLAEIQDAD